MGAYHWRETSEHCLTCRFWLGPSFSDTQCRRYPSKVDKGWAEWCGEFQRVDDKEWQRREALWHDIMTNPQDHL